MFESEGLSTALDAMRLTQKNKESAAREESERQHKRQVHNKRWTDEFLQLWKTFLAGEEWARLKGALEQIDCPMLRISDRYLEFQHKDTETPFVIVHISGGYYSTRSETRHSAEGYFSQLASMDQTPKEALALFLRDLDEAFEREKHIFRYRHDPNYRDECNRVERQRRNAARARFWRWTAFIVAVLVVAGGYGLYSLLT